MSADALARALPGEDWDAMVVDYDSMAPVALLAAAYLAAAAVVFGTASVAGLVWVVRLASRSWRLVRQPGGPS